MARGVLSTAPINFQHIRGTDLTKKFRDKGKQFSVRLDGESLLFAKSCVTALSLGTRLR